MNAETEYKLIAGKTVEEFNAAVNQALTDNFVLHGTPFADPTSLYQAVTRQRVTPGLQYKAGFGGRND